MYRPSTIRSITRQFGFSLIELMIGITISLIVVAGLVGLYVNLSTTNVEMERANSQIESGRFAIFTLQNDLSHAGFWGSFVPQFDNQGAVGVPVDTPQGIPDPCLPFTTANWTSIYKYNLIGIPVNAYDTIPANCANAPASLSGQVAGTDVLVVRHAATCATPPPGGGNYQSCAPYNQYDANQMYFQSSQCAPGLYNQTAQAVTAQDIAVTPGLSLTNSIKLSSGFMTTIPNTFVGMTIALTGGTGAGQSRLISSFSASTNIARVTPDWSIAPDNTTTYNISEYVLDSDNGNAGASKFSMHRIGQDCSTAPLADLRKFVSNIYFVRSYRDTPGDGIPTLMRSRFDVGASNVLGHQSAEAIVEGIQGFHVQFGFDTMSSRCSPATAVRYDQAVALVDPATCVNSTNAALNTLATNRGDGTPEQYSPCTGGTACTVAQMTNVVSVRIYVLARSRSVTPGYRDTKTYTLGDVVMGPFNDGFKRHVFTTTVRLPNVSDRRG